MTWQRGGEIMLQGQLRSLMTLWSYAGGPDVIRSILENRHGRQKWWSGEIRDGLIVLLVLKLEEAARNPGLWGASGSWESKGADFLLGLLDGNVAQPTP